ncbi:acyl carrier protein [Arcticibacter sp. MXS-1]|uniref:acyl carrier protein n=1 Tax=Arcticibacter sp. MXS-1 TaxID=3341726 RepID=UPI0035A81D3E
MKDLIREQLCLVSGLPESAFPDHADLRKDVGLDSIAMIEMVTGLEDKFLISIPQKDYFRLKSIDSINEYLHERAVETPQ